MRCVNTRTVHRGVFVRAARDTHLIDRKGLLALNWISGLSKSAPAAQSIVATVFEAGSPGFHPGVRDDSRTKYRPASATYE